MVNLNSPERAALAENSSYQEEKWRRLGYGASIAAIARIAGAKATFQKGA